MRFFLLLLLVALPGCGGHEPTVILVSLDGFRPDYLERFDLPVLQDLAANGVTADGGMEPVFPSLTFPNHYTIATGLYPAHHGITSNTMYDPDMDAEFRIRDREAVEDGRWWGGEPIWVTAELQGQTAASFFWVGSEAPVKGVQPTYWHRFDASIPGEDRVDQVLEWLALPSDQRPTFITLYFEHVDGAGHGFGPLSAEAEAAAVQVDGFVGRLTDGLTEMGLRDRVHLIITSDHGMTDRSSERVVVLETYVDVPVGRVTGLGPYVMLEPEPQYRERVADGLRQMPHVTLLDADVLASRYRYAGNRRIPSIVAQAQLGWSVVPSHEWTSENPGQPSGGSHGYAPEEPDMSALFIATGPAFRTGATVPSFKNIHVYNLLAHLLGLDPAENDGDFEVVKPMLAP